MTETRKRSCDRRISERTFRRAWEGVLGGVCAYDDEAHADARLSADAVDSDGDLEQADGDEGHDDAKLGHLVVDVDDAVEDEEGDEEVDAELHQDEEDLVGEVALAQVDVGRDVFVDLPRELAVQLVGEGAHAEGADADPGRVGEEGGLDDGPVFDVGLDQGDAAVDGRQHLVVGLVRLEVAHDVDGEEGAVADAEREELDVVAHRERVDGEEELPPAPEDEEADVQRDGVGPHRQVGARVNPCLVLDEHEAAGRGGGRVSAGTTRRRRAEPASGAASRSRSVVGLMRTHTSRIRVTAACAATIPRKPASHGDRGLYMMFGAGSVDLASVDTWGNIIFSGFDKGMAAAVRSLTWAIRGSPMSNCGAQHGCGVAEMGPWSGHQTSQALEQQDTPHNVKMRGDPGGSEDGSPASAPPIGRMLPPTGRP